MPEVLDWQLGDPRLALERAVQHLTAGRLVVFPTETGYHVAASALHPEALAALGQIGNTDDAVLAVRGLDEAIRWAPWMSTTARRLARRCWPGPVTLIIEYRADAMAAPPFAGGKGTIRLRVPAHEALLAALGQLSAPVILVPLAAETVDQMESALGSAVALMIVDGPPAPAMSPTVVEVQGDHWKVTREGSVTAAMLQSLMPTTILFVCTGNTCRSPMAQVLCEKLLAERLGCGIEELPQRGFLVLSAGLAAMMGAQASPEAVETARECGADLSGHASQPLTADLLARADYLFAMTASHLRALLPFVAQELPQPRLLARDGTDVPDPIGREPEVYRECAQLILRHLHDCLEEIQPLQHGGHARQGES
jgi:L-threonylcarbamoyladenylate synthase